MRIRNVALLTSFLVISVACAEGKTNSPAGTGGAGGTTVGTGGTGAGTTSGVCDLQTKDATCNDCINTTCFSSCNACATNQACNDLLSCVADCPASDTACENTCIGQNPAGEAPFNAFLGETGCVNVSCETECGSTGCGLTLGDEVCDSCMEASCYNECAACADTPECLQLSECLYNCADTDTTCQDQCVNTYSAGYDPLLNLLGTEGCIELQCSAQCG